MKTSRSVDVCVMVVFMSLFTGAPCCVLGGHPVWPPPRHSVEYRQANMLFLRFHDALAAEQWQDALSFCSERVRTKAAEWPSAKDFFNETEHVTLQRLASSQS